MIALCLQCQNPWNFVFIEHICIIIVIFFYPPMSPSSLQCSVPAVSLPAPLVHLFWGNKSHSYPFDTHFNTHYPARLLWLLIRFGSSNWISLWNKHPFMHIGKHTNAPKLDIETMLSWLFTWWLLFSVKAANRSKITANNLEISSAWLLWP